MTKNQGKASIDDKLNDKKEYWKGGCCEYILCTLKAANHALGYLDFGNTYTYGTLRNGTNKLVKRRKLLALPKECPARFILPKWAHRPEYSCVQRTDKEGGGVKFDFLSYLEHLQWNPVLGLHDLKLVFWMYQFHWIGNEWKYCKKSKSYSKQFELSYPVSVQCYDTGLVLVSIRCSAEPFPFDLEGLGALRSLLGELKNALHASGIPEPGTWLIKQWHLNRDSSKFHGGSPGGHLTFDDFFGDSAQFYYKRGLSRYRVEVSQNPKKSVQEIFEDVLNRDSIPKGGV
jgi:hypothetical protein